MTRFAGSAVDFTPASLQSAAGGSGYSGAADAVSLNDTYAAQREKAPKYDELANTAMQTRSAERQAAVKAEADVTGAGINAIGQTKSAMLQAQGAVAAAKAQASASKTGSMMGAIGKIGGALIGLSDETTKTAITPIDSALATLRALKPVTFYYKPEFGDHTRKHHGFVAQEFEKVLPDATYVDAINKKKCIDTGDVIGLLVRANQELEARITRMEAKLVLEKV